MHSRASAYAVAFVLVASCPIACDTDEETAAASLAGPRAAGRVAGSLMSNRLSTTTIEPAILAGELRANPSCFAEAPFDVRLNVNVRARQELFIRSIDFEFFDPLNRRVLPLVLPGIMQVNNSVVPPLSLPATHPIPFPGQTALSNVIVPAGGSFTAPFRLQFECGVPARGILLTSVAAADQRGAVGVSRVSARIGE